MEWALATWEVVWEEEEVEEEGQVCTIFQKTLKILQSQSGSCIDIDFYFFSVAGMDNFGGMNNMDRFGSSGMGRTNGKEIF